MKKNDITTKIADELSKEQIILIVKCITVGITFNLAVHQIIKLIKILKGGF